ncbi:hypothetical protein FA15DRAFT_674049 [Coprinopsis marcescibilis]|uniref:DUF6534 domain-containing protein n=1 Tax=Coprinopsis marcescibilis TaxID=230819 RepID=A0A5C3KI19_COPMA|nr:hypothetical protein FA15DRAFT_674049 [Coprinopsis marcescibilis]
MSSRVNVSFLLMGSYLNIGFFALECDIFLRYWLSKRRKEDPKKVWVSVLVCFGLDIVASLSACAMVYVALLSNWGASEEFSWPFPIDVFTTGIVSFVVRCFMIHRYWNFTLNRVWSPILLICAVITFIFTMASGAVLIVHNKVDDGFRKTRFSLGSLTGGVISNMLVTGNLIHSLWESPIHDQETRSMIKKLTSLAIQTGCIPTVFALAALITHACIPSTLVAFSFMMPLGNIYSCTLLYTLLSRDRIRGDSWIHTDPVPIPEPPQSHVKERSPTEMVFARPEFIGRPTYARQDSDVV